MSISLPITAVTPVRNESPMLAPKLGVREISFAPDDKFPKKRNWVLRNDVFKTERVLLVDADKVVTPAFLKSWSGSFCPTITLFIRASRIVEAIS